MSTEMDTVLEDLLQVQHLNAYGLLNSAVNTPPENSNGVGSQANDQTTVEHGEISDDTYEIIRILVHGRSSPDEVVCARVLHSSNPNARFEWHDIHTEDLDFTHKVYGTLTFTTDPDWRSTGLQGGDLVVKSRLPSLLSIFSQWRAGDLRELAHAHEIRITSKDSCTSLAERLDEHLCRPFCPTVLVIFRSLQRPREVEHVERVRSTFRAAALTSSHSYLQVASDHLRRSIIQEWQNAFTTDNFSTLVCAPCGRRTVARDIVLVSPVEFELSLLRNEGLPPKVEPTTYDFVAYGKALLNPKGLTERWRVADIRMCEVCRRDLVVKRRMPRLCLANWLYYARDELPTDVKTAFESSTYTDRLLIGRARTSRISFRFSELRKKSEVDTVPNPAADSSTTERFASQGCLKGNVLVMPQDSTHLNSVLPPPPETIRDTVCAVFVGTSKPTKDTIGKLGPLLVRKSRVATLTRFLTCENPHYACDTEFHGFSQRNLDSLFGPGTEDQDEGVPCAMEVGFIEDNVAIRTAESDYTDRNVLDDEPAHDDQSLLMENVGYTQGDEPAFSYRNMKMKALSHCLAGGRFLRSQAGDRFVPDFENPSLLTWLFPHLDPWGIGSFHEPARDVSISMEEQLKYLLQLDDSPFERDPDFAFVYYNILQKKAVCESVRFRVKVAQQREVVRQLLSVDREDLQRLIARFKANAHYEPDTPQQQRLVALVNKVGTMLHDLPGTAGYKLKMRNEIRALINMRGTPAFFITLNPSDVNHPLVRLLSGDNIRLEHLEAGQDLTEWQRMLLVAHNPAACAKFFHTIISSFIGIVLRHGKKERGLLGKCTAYYGTVETQGRGTLHCHMLVWLHGHPSPQQMRDLMVDSSQYQTDMFTWLESLIKCELLGTSMVVNETAGPLPRPKIPKINGYVHPGTVLGPSVADLTPEQFWLHFASSVNDVVTHSNWHQHTDTCWKHLRRGEKRTDDNCRMRINGTTRESTTVDEDTGAILLRRLHPRIANYNDLIIFLLRANMDIKHIGSGEATKALIFYLTDYITKASLPAHVGLAALLYAINRTQEKYGHMPNWQDTQHTGALTVFVNSMMARQEISHQQVMAYLVGGGDNYKSDKFKVLHYGSFERLVQRHWAITDYDMSPQLSGEGEHLSSPMEPSATAADTSIEPTDVTRDCLDSLMHDDDNITLLLGAGSISAVNQQQDYLFRPFDEPFASMGLYEYVGMTEKITKDSETKRILRRQDERADDHRRGRPEESRAEFSPEHPQYQSHVVRKRTIWAVPVVLGDRIPRHDRSDEERENWARTILTLFLPWRHPRDFKEDSEPWTTAYDRFAPMISPEHMAIIHNMNVLSECKDARDKASLARRLSRLPKSNVLDRAPSPDPFDVFDHSVLQISKPTVGESDPQDPDTRESTLLSALDTNIGTRFRHAIDTCFAQIPSQQLDAQTYGTPMVLTDENRVEIEAQHATMRRLKRKRRPETAPDQLQDTDRNVRRRRECLPTIDSMRLGDAPAAVGSTSRNPTVYNSDDIVYQVILEKNLLSNAEQLRAFEIVSDHVLHGQRQLLMYTGGVGGTGKSHLVHSILRLFSLLGKHKSILVAAPTGAAAILIGGHTIHSLTLLPDIPGRDLQELMNIWDGVDYLILDEISMVGATFFSNLHARLLRAKACDDAGTDMPFGGLNIIFTGDFGQLRPVRDPPLYSHNLVQNAGLDNCRGKTGVSAIIGVYLWRQVTTVVLLKKNQRQAGDQVFSELLSRVRVGEANSSTTKDTRSDFAILKTRYADRVDLSSSAPSFANAAIIVGRKKIRDLLNLRIMGHHARSLSTDIHLYHAKDKIAGQPVTTDERVKLWTLSSTITQDSLGKLPLFPGMKVMVQENLAFTNGVVNGTEGTVRNIVYEEEEGKRYAAAVYVHIPGAGNICTNASEDVVPIFPECTTFTWTRVVGTTVQRTSVTRYQLPLLPSYAYTDYKSQGRSLDYAIIDPASAATLQGVYVMLSRVRTLDGLMILRPFKPNKIQQRLSQELRTELRRLEQLDEVSRTQFKLSYWPTPNEDDTTSDVNVSRLPHTQY